MDTQTKKCRECKVGETCTHLCQHMLDGRSTIIKCEGYEWCLRCMLITKQPRSLWQSIKDYLKTWYGRHSVSDYPYDDQENM